MGIGSAAPGGSDHEPRSAPAQESGVVMYMPHDRTYFNEHTGWRHPHRRPRPSELNPDQRATSTTGEPICAYSLTDTELLSLCIYVITDSYDEYDQLTPPVQQRIDLLKIEIEAFAARRITDKRSEDTVLYFIPEVLTRDVVTTAYLGFPVRELSGNYGNDIIQATQRLQREARLNLR